MTAKQRKTKLESYPIFLTIFVIATILLNWFSVRIIHRTKSNIISSMEIEMARIERSFSDKLEQTYATIKDINQQIAKNPKDLNHIRAVLQNYDNLNNLGDAFAWSIFSWISDEYYLVVDAKYGIMKEPIDVSARDYIYMSEREPEKFNLGTPCIGETSKKWILPAGVGLEDKNKKYVGTTVIGIRLAELSRILQRVVQNENVNFKFFSKNGISIVNSGSKTHENRDSYDDSTNNIEIEKIINHVNTSENALKYFSSVNLFKNRQAILARKINDDYPYVIIMYYDNDQILPELYKVVKSRSAELLSILFSFAVLFYLIYRKIKQTRSLFRMKLVAERANNSKSEFLTRVTHEFKNFIFGIHGCAEIIRDDLRKISAALKKEKNPKNLQHLRELETDLEMANNIIETSHDLDIFINELMGLNRLKNGDLKIKASPSVDLAKVVQSILPALRKRAKNSDVILLVTEIDKNLHEVPNLDPKRIKQIISGLVFNAIRYSKNETVVMLTVRNIDDEATLQNIYQQYGIKKTQAVEILITDQNSHINNYKIGSTLNDIKNFKSFDAFAIKLPTIKFLIEKQEGIFEMRSIKNGGNETRVIF